MRCDICRAIKKKSEFVSRPCECATVNVCGACLAAWFLEQRTMTCPSCRRRFEKPDVPRSLLRRYRRVTILQDDHIASLDRTIVLHEKIRSLLEKQINSLRIHIAFIIQMVDTIAIIGIVFALFNP